MMKHNTNVSPANNSKGAGTSARVLEQMQARCANEKYQRVHQCSERINYNVSRQKELQVSQTGAVRLTIAQPWLSQ